MIVTDVGAYGSRLDGETGWLSRRAIPAHSRKPSRGSVNDSAARRTLGLARASGRSHISIRGSALADTKSFIAAS